MHRPTASSCHGTADRLPYVESRTAWYAVHVARFQAKAKNLPGRRAINQQWIIVNCIHKLPFQELKLQCRTSLLKHVLAVPSLLAPQYGSLWSKLLNLPQHGCIFAANQDSTFSSNSTNCSLLSRSLNFVTPYLKVLHKTFSIAPKHKAFGPSFSAIPDSNSFNTKTLFQTKLHLLHRQFRDVRQDVVFFFGLALLPKQKFTENFSGLSVKREAILAKGSHRDTFEVQEAM